MGYVLGWAREGQRLDREGQPRGRLTTRPSAEAAAGSGPYDCCRRGVGRQRSSPPRSIGSTPTGTTPETNVSFFFSLSRASIFFSLSSARMQEKNSRTLVRTSFSYFLSSTLRAWAGPQSKTRFLLLSNQNTSPRLNTEISK